MEIKILGSGCANCQRLDHNAHLAADELGLDVSFEKVTDPAEIASWGVMSTPALVIDDEVVVSGRVASQDDIKQLLAGR